MSRLQAQLKAQAHKQQQLGGVQAHSTCPSTPRLVHACRCWPQLISIFRGSMNATINFSRLNERRDSHHLPSSHLPSHPLHCSAGASLGMRSVHGVPGRLRALSPPPLRSGDISCVRGPPPPQYDSPHTLCSIHCSTIEALSAEWHTATLLIRWHTARNSRTIAAGQTAGVP